MLYKCSHRIIITCQGVVPQIATERMCCYVCLDTTVIIVVVVVVVGLLLIAIVVGVIVIVVCKYFRYSFTLMLPRFPFGRIYFVVLVMRKGGQSS